jgi:cyclin-dependent kinase 7
MEAYEKLGKLGEGAWGVVVEAVQKSTGRRVAIKRVRMGKFREGVNFTALREVKVLQELRHENIVELLDVFMLYESINLVFEFCETDMETIIMDTSTVLSPGDVKCHMRMLMSAIAFCHEHGVLHRDLKPNNLLYTSEGLLKLADFGLARLQGSPGRMMTSQVVTRWYRPPELCFGCREYSAAVDMWGVGCILAELLLRRPLFPGSSDLEQVAKIFQVMGTPTDLTWPDASSLPEYVEFKPQPKLDVSSLFTAATPDAMDLLSKLLVLHPAKRMGAADALRHAYFSNAPPPSDPGSLSLPLPEERKGLERKRGAD